MFPNLEVMGGQRDGASGNHAKIAGIKSLRGFSRSAASSLPTLGPAGCLCRRAEFAGHPAVADRIGPDQSKGVVPVDFAGREGADGLLAQQAETFRSLLS